MKYNGYRVMIAVLLELQKQGFGPKEITLQKMDEVMTFAFGLFPSEEGDERDRAQRIVEENKKICENV